MFKGCVSNSHLWFIYYLLLHNSTHSKWTHFSIVFLKFAYNVYEVRILFIILHSLTPSNWIFKIINRIFHIYLRWCSFIPTIQHPPTNQCPGLKVPKKSHQLRSAKTTTPDQYHHRNVFNSRGGYAYLYMKSITLSDIDGVYSSLYSIKVCISVEKYISHHKTLLRATKVIQLRRLCMSYVQRII